MKLLIFTSFLVLQSVIFVSWAGPVLNPGGDHDDHTNILDRVFVAVKTTGKFHATRLARILTTWVPRLRDRTWVFTDTPADQMNLGDRLVVTNCGVQHNRKDLSCKMEAELTAFLAEASQPQWFCHVDDDNYLNPKALARMLSGYSQVEEWYLGKASIPAPLEIIDRSGTVVGSSSSGTRPHPTLRFWFATGGAGFCLSRPLVERMQPLIVDGGFQRIADEIRLPDDVTVGYVVEILLGGRLTHIPAHLHSHLEPLRLISRPEEAVTLSYSRYEDNGELNVVDMLEAGGGGVDKSVKAILNDNSVDGDGGAAGGDETELLGSSDWTRFGYIHCRIYPEDCGEGRVKTRPHQLGWE